MTTLDRLINEAEACRIAGLPRTSLRRQMAATQGPGAFFPRPVKTGPRRVRWSENAVLEWVSKQAPAHAGGEANNGGPKQKAH